MLQQSIDTSERPSFRCDGCDAKFQTAEELYDHDCEFFLNEVGGVKLDGTATASSLDTFSRTELRWWFTGFAVFLASIAVTAATTPCTATGTCSGVTVARSFAVVFIGAFVFWLAATRTEATNQHR